MIALDTNILVRFLLRDDKKQAELVYARFMQAEKNGEQLFVPLLVLQETIWVLESVYELSRSDVLCAIEDLLHLPILKFETDEVVLTFLNDAKSSQTDLADILIGCSAKSNGSEAIITFDKKASRLPYFQLLRMP